jgi:hypothetical protein
MKKKQLLLKKNLWSLLSVVIFFTATIVTQSCNNDKKGPGDGKKAQDELGKTDSAAAPQATTLDAFPILFIAFQDITTTFNSLPGNQIKKIAFSFQFDGGVTNGQPTLIGYAGKQNGVYTTSNPSITLKKTSIPISLADTLNLGDLELSRAAYTSLLSNPQTYLVFIPTRINMGNNKNYVTYNTAWSNVSPTSFETKSFNINSLLIIGEPLKPSPPAPPDL